MVKQRIKNLVGVRVVLLLLCFLFMGISFMPVTARAETASDRDAEVLTPQTVVDNAMFVTFKKGDTADRGKFILACYYTSDEYYEESFEYGVLVFPFYYIERFITRGDYINEFAEQSIPIINLTAPVHWQTPEGKMYRCGISNMLDANLNREFAFIFYVQDGDVIAYTEPTTAIYNTLQAENYTDQELLDILGQKLTMVGSFKMIVAKLNELVDAFWIYLVLACSGAVVLWASYIGIKIAIAKNKEQKIDSKDMVENLCIGIGVMFILAVAMPLLIKGLTAWVG